MRNTPEQPDTIPCPNCAYCETFRLIAPKHGYNRFCAHCNRPFTVAFPVDIYTRPGDELPATDRATPAATMPPGTHPDVQRQPAPRQRKKRAPYNPAQESMF